MSNNERTTETATVTCACEVSFAVGSCEYGTISVPVGTKVFRFIFKSKDAEWKPFTTKVSDWFLSDDDMIRLCPESLKVNGKVPDLYAHDATHYGITLPNANVRPDGKEAPKAKHRAFHY